MHSYLDSSKLAEKVTLNIHYTKSGPLQDLANPEDYSLNLIKSHFEPKSVFQTIWM